MATPAGRLILTLAAAATAIAGCGGAAQTVATANGTPDSRPTEDSSARPADTSPTGPRIAPTPGPMSQATATASVPTPATQSTASPIGLPAPTAARPAPTAASDPSALPCAFASDRIAVSVDLTHATVSVGAVITAAGEPLQPVVAEAKDVVVGGRSYRVHFTMQMTDSVGPFPPLGVKAFLARAGGVYPVRVVLHGADAVLTLPDASGPASLVMEVVAGDASCRPGQAEATVRVNLVAAATAAACPSGATDPVVAPVSPAVQIGSDRVRLDTITIQARYSRYATGDFVGPFAGYDPMLRPLVDPAGADLLVRSIEPSLTISAVRAHAWIRSAVLRPDGTLRPGQPTAGDVLRLTEVHPGLLRLTLPAKAGAYVVDIDLGWQTDCAEGAAVLAVAFDLH